MNLLLYVNIYLFPIILLAIIYYSVSQKVIQTTARRLFQRLLLVTLLVLVLELLLWIVDGQTFAGAGLLVWVVEFVSNALIMILALSWLLYIYYRVFGRTVKMMKPWEKGLIVADLIIYYAVLLANLATHLIFYVDEENHYVAGTLSWLPKAWTMIIIASTMIMTTIHIFHTRLESEKRRYGFLNAFTLMLLISYGMQSLIPDLKAALPIAALTELYMYIQTQNQQITRDALTGLNNRWCFDQYLNGLLEQHDHMPPTYLFMMDMDEFKKINDTYGHAVGDRALIQAGEVLAGFFHATGAFVARYGGDEFCVVHRCRGDAEANLLIEQLNEAFTKKMDPELPYRLAISVGYVRIDNKPSLTQAMMIRSADKMMYENKRRRRRK